MSGGKTRPLIQIIIRNFIDSLKPRQFTGDKIGTDYVGNSYFEIKRSGGRRASRWFEPKVKEDFQSEIPAEWESWLRHRRSDPPTQEEIDKNLAVMMSKKANAHRLEQERLAEGGALPTVPDRGPETFPRYKEYEIGGVPVKK